MLGLLLTATVLGVFFFVSPDSRSIIWVFIFLVGCALLFLLWVFIPFRFAAYVSFFSAYVLFLVAEHVMRADLIIYALIIVVFTELFVGRRIL
jgi:hypothetical protein